MKRSHEIATAVALALGLGLAAGAYAHPDQMSGRMGQGMHSGVQHGGPQERGAASQLITPEERAAFQEKMRNAKTPQEPREIAQAHRAEVQKRAQEKGIALPEHRGPRGRVGAAPAPTLAPQLPADAEHVH